MIASKNKQTLENNICNLSIIAGEKYSNIRSGP